MKLYEVYKSRDVLSKIASFKLGTQLAYRLMKFVKKIVVELDEIEAMRVKIVRDCAGVSDGDVSIQPGTSEYAAFVTEFSDFLESGSEIPSFDLTMDEFITELAKSPGNDLSANDIMLLEPLFKSENDNE